MKVKVWHEPCSGRGNYMRSQCMICGGKGYIEEELYSREAVIKAYNNGDSDGYSCNCIDTSNADEEKMKIILRNFE